MRAILLLIMTGAVLLLPAVSAHEENVHLTFEGKESGCPAGKSMCFTLTNGSMADMQPGATVEIHFENKGAAEHMWMITPMDRMDSMHKGTDHMQAMAAIEDVPPGGSGNATFTVPMDAKGMYIWCGEPGHEGAGMWTLQEFETESAGGAGTPIPWFLSLVAIAGGVFLVRDRLKQS